MRDASLAVIREIGVETGGIEYSVCDPAGHGTDDRDRDESAGESFECLGKQGYRISDRKDRSETGRGLSALGTAQRYHSENEGLL